MAYIDDIVQEFEKSLLEHGDLLESMNTFNLNTSNQFVPLSEAEYDKAVTHLKLDILDTDRFIKTNNCKPITNPVFYDRTNVPTSDGLLSNEIFGITQADRSGIFGYIDLGDWYMDPSCYKIWTRLDSNVKKCVHKTAKFIINEKGELVEDENGKNGIKFLKDNITKIKFKSSESIKRDLKVRYMERNRNNIFINKYLVIPPYYRDTNTSKRSVGVGGVNKLYSQLIIATNSVKTTQEYGFDMSGPMQGRVQEIILSIYDWFAGNTNSSINEKDVGVGLSGKMGIMRRANMTKTSNYSARLVISAPELKVNRPEDMMVTFDKSAVPLAACIACYRPFVQFFVRRFFENEFIGTEQYPVLDKDGRNPSYEAPKDPLIEFSDERIKTEMEKFIHSYNNRFVPIRVPLEDPKKEVYMQLKGRFSADNPLTEESIYLRRLTWCDVFYMATVEAIKGKMALITRYPVDSRFNEITTEIEVSSTKETEPMFFENNYYRYYPKIREEDIGTNTGDKFIDTLKLSNLYLPGLGGDYDGDTVVIKGAFTNEVSEELKQFRDSKMNFIDFGSSNIRSSSKDVIQAIYNLTKVLDADKSKLVNPVF